MDINAHAHVFNLRALLSESSRDIVRRRLVGEIEEALPSAVAKKLAKALVDLVDELGAVDERRLVERLVEELSGVELPDEGPLGDVVGAAGGALSRRVLDWMVSRLRSSSDEAYRSKSVGEAIEMLRAAASTDIQSVAKRLFEDLNDDVGAVALTLDITTDASDPELFEKQLRDTGDLVLRFPGRVFPFASVNTQRRHESRGFFDFLRLAHRELGFVGVKLYPSLGSPVDDQHAQRVHDYCEEHELPQLLHCNQGGFFLKKETIPLGRPTLWAPILEKRPGLKVCFGHFGGAGGLAGASVSADDELAFAAGHWAGEILELMRRFPGVYADLSAHSAPMKNDAARERYFENLEHLLRPGSRFRERILFGTDFWMMRLRLREGAHWSFFRGNLSAESWNLLASRNPARFLGLPDVGGTAGSIAIEEHVEWIAERAAAKLTARPAPWLELRLKERFPAALTTIQQSIAGREPSGALQLVGGWKGVLDATAEGALAPPKGATLEPATSLATTLGGIPVGITGKARVRATLFTNNDQRDPRGILLPPPAGGQGSPVGQRLRFDPASQWLAVEIAGELKLEAALKLDADLGLAAEGGADLVEYRRHPADRPLREVLRAQLGAPRFALSTSDVLRMGVGDALVFRRWGTFRARAELALHEAASVALASGASLLRLAPGTLDVEVDYGLSVSASFAYSDELEVVITRPSTDSWSVALFKADARQLSGRLALAAGVRLAQPESLGQWADALLEQKLGEPAATVAAVAGKAPKWLGDVAARLGVPANAKAVAKRVGELREELVADMQKALEKRLAVGFSYEYRRLAAGAALLDAELGASGMEELHGAVLRGDLDILLDRFERERRYLAGRESEWAVRKIHTFLETETRAATRSWGFSLGPISSRDTRRHQWIIQRLVREDGSQGQRIAFEGQRSYVTNLPKRRLAVDFRAEMPGFWTGNGDPSIDASPLGESDALAVDDAVPEVSIAGSDPARGFQYGFVLTLEWEPKDYKSDAVVEAFDGAALWGALPFDGSQTELAADRFKEWGLKKGSARLLLQMLVPHDALFRMLPEASDRFEELLPGAFAAAMPYFDLAPQKSPQSRLTAYRQQWASVLQLSRWDWDLAVKSPSQRAAGSRKILEQCGFAKDAHFEDDAKHLKRPWTFAGAFSLHPKAWAAAQDLRRGLAVLTEAEDRKGARPYTHIRDQMFDKLAPFFRNTLYVRAFGALWRFLAENYGVEGLRTDLRLIPEKGTAARIVATSVSPRG